ncbi:MAG: protein-methionine-sulfoxide reductase heme-binding subunit MsrQ [Alphaproteobacteria bacterium HGW-Alphaproteobacteria-2]|nr:MAG: protein-methionine-sulfoxide reductase heme-binding subunit MsrQ [Alphaproteobacteria bacterium HGW-Alphaproteobacteria-2]
MPGAEALNAAARRVPRGAIYVLGALPAVFLLQGLFAGSLGPDPAKVVERELGLTGLQFLMAALAITPLRRIAGINFIRHRRALGLLAFFYIVLHLAAWVVLDFNLLWGEMLRDILKRPYITVGMLGFAAMLPLAVTANDAAIRRMGAAAWQRLHRLAYLAALAGALHFLLLVKTLTPSAVLHAGAILMLLALRVGWAIRRGRIRTLRGA